MVYYVFPGLLVWFVSTVSFFHLMKHFHRKQEFAPYSTKRGVEELGYQFSLFRFDMMAPMTNAFGYEELSAMVRDVLVASPVQNLTPAYRTQLGVEFVGGFGDTPFEMNPDTTVAIAQGIDM
jgi:hypothetical protein